MKKLLAILIIIAIPIILFFQYSNWKRFNPPSEYLYEISDEIDISYHDAALVQEYFGNAVEIGRYAKQKYASSKVDVLHPDESDAEAMNASKYYHQLVARTKYLEALLIQSAEHKKEDRTNHEIKHLETTGLMPEQLDKEKERENYVGLAFGSRNKYVWNVQKHLSAKGFEVPIDGLFGVETRAQTSAFQEANGIYPSGQIDDETYDLLITD